MKTKVIIWSLGLMMILGCSTDSLNDTYDISSDRYTETEKSVQSMEFQISTRGDFRLVRSYACFGLTQFEMQGSAELSNFGNLSNSITYCTDLREEHNLNGSFMNKNGEELFFVSKETGKDEKGQFHKMVLYGYTGVFKDFYATAKVYMTQEYTGHNIGYYRMTGTGQGGWITD